MEGVRKGNWDTVKMTAAQKSELAKKVIESASVHIEGFGEAGSEVDAGVTFDVSKLIRLPESLHGETGLAARRISGVSELASFDPMTSAVVLGDAPIRIKCGRVPKFTMKGVEYGPFNNEEVELPEHAAVYLVCKRKATLWR
jgi:DNA primase small subunit